ncbi:MAG TPA: hypothetical protein VEP90_12765, partial [Methylomirabilota bacterium]|nr:hypothetical protein [Methylomirabilota bacterium]
MGPRNVSSQQDTTKISDKTVHETLNTIHKAIVQFLNLSNRNIVEFKDILAQKIREQDARITSISDNVHQIKKKNDILYDNVRRLEYKYRNLTYQQKGQEQQEPIPLKKTGISALLLAAIAGLFLLYQYADKIKARLNAWLGRKEEEHTRPEVESEKKPPIVESPEDLKVHKSLINIDGEIINMETFHEFCFDARKMVFKADEIVVESPQIILQSNPIVDPTYGQWEAGAATTQQFQPDAQHPPVVSSTPQFPMHSPTQPWDEGVQAVPSGPGPNPTPTAPSDPGQTFGLPPITPENAFPYAKPIDTPVRPPMQGATDADTEAPLEPDAKPIDTPVRPPMQGATDADTEAP